MKGINLLDRIMDSIAQNRCLAEETIDETANFVYDGGHKYAFKSATKILQESGVLKNPKPVAVEAIIDGYMFELTEGDKKNCYDFIHNMKEAMLKQ